MHTSKLLSPIIIGEVYLNNRVVMAGMTRNRAINNCPNHMMASYYEQRADAGLIITEGTAPSPNGLGIVRMPGIFNEDQIHAWSKITSRVHHKGGRIFLQLLHSGRLGHPLNMILPAEVIGPSPIQASGQVWTDQQGLQDYLTPREMTEKDISQVKMEFVSAAKNAILAGFDGIEILAGNGYLLEQFISPASNTRIDNYGGNVQNRCRIVLEIVEHLIQATNNGKIGVQISPYSTAGDMPHYPEIDETYKYLTEEINKLDIAYLHLSDHSARGDTLVPLEIKIMIRNVYKNAIMLSGGYDLERAENDVESNFAKLIAFGRPYINNPDLKKRFQNQLPIEPECGVEHYHSKTEIGYSDYPRYGMITKLLYMLNPLELKKFLISKKDKIEKNME